MNQKVTECIFFIMYIYLFCLKAETQIEGNSVNVSHITLVTYVLNLNTHTDSMSK